MRKTGVLRSVAACATILLTILTGPEHHAQAQRTTGLEGLYKLEHLFTWDLNSRKWTEITPIPQEQPKEIWLLTGNEYLWGTYWGEFQTPTPGSVVLCGHSDGEIEGAGHVTTATDPDNYVRKRYALVYQKPVDQRDLPRRDTWVTPKKLCKKGSSSIGWIVAAAPQDQEAGGLYAQAGQPRGVDGEVVFTLDEKPTRSDAGRWTCIVTQGFPGIELIDLSGGPAQSVFVWPDGRFRVPLKGGTNYTWRVRGSSCGITEQVSRNNTFSGPSVPPPTDEKILLACFIKNDAYDKCSGWWLQRP